MDNKKTRIGKQPDLPFIPKDQNRGLSCPKCSYPLLVEPSHSSPCPNCGYGGETGIHDTASDSKKTISLSDLNLKNEEKLTSFKFKMISESSGSQFNIESEETEIILNRAHLDPDNTSISSTEHLLVKFRDGKIFVQDVSSNGSTFIQVYKKFLINLGTKIIMGNKTYSFSGGKTTYGLDKNKATRQLNMVNLNNDNLNNPVLVDDQNGRKIDLNQGINILNRQNLDPGNATISGKEHAILEYKDDQWYISDSSSNAATFIQCTTEHQIVNKSRIIVGNIIFRFEYD